MQQNAGKGPIAKQNSAEAQFFKELIEEYLKPEPPDPDPEKVGPLLW